MAEIISCYLREIFCGDTGAGGVGLSYIVIIIAVVILSLQQIGDGYFLEKFGNLPAQIYVTVRGGGAKN